MLIVTCLFNILLLVPDLNLIENPSAKLRIATIRVSYSILLIVVLFTYRRIQSFTQLSVITTICEMLATGTFLYVFSQYNNPSFLIQTLGLISLTLAIFVIPNQWIFMLLVSLFGAVGFYFCSLNFVGSLDRTEYAASISYVGIAILLCAVSAINSERLQFKEFVTKRELERISTTDFLTSTANRLKISEEAKAQIDFCKQRELPLSLMFFDVDNLKIINDRHGHSAGDTLLRDLALLIQRQLRSTGVLARWGGDEFLILLPNVSLDNAIALAKTIELSVKENISINGDKVTCSFGVVTMKNNSTFEDLVCEADNLMYSVKHQGKDLVEFSR